jgi:hypothetical protein
MEAITAHTRKRIAAAILAAATGTAGLGAAGYLLHGSPTSGGTSHPAAYLLHGSPTQVEWGGVVAGAKSPDYLLHG